MTYTRKKHAHMNARTLDGRAPHIPSQYQRSCTVLRCDILKSSVISETQQTGCIIGCISH